MCQGTDLLREADMEEYGPKQTPLQFIWQGQNALADPMSLPVCPIARRFFARSLAEPVGKPRGSYRLDKASRPAAGRTVFATTYAEGARSGHGDGARGRCQLQVFAYIGAFSGDFLQPACEKSPRTVPNSLRTPLPIMKLPEPNGTSTQNWANQAISGD